MKEKIVNLTDEFFIDSGDERVAYIHPDDLNKLIKVTRKDCKDIQSKRENRYFKKLQKRLSDEDWKHIPRFYGTCKTNLGDGQVVELIRDFDGEISKRLQFYIEKNGIKRYRHLLDELREYFLKHYIIFARDIATHNILLKRSNENEETLVLIDAIGDVVLIPILNIFPNQVRKKIARRWEHFEKKLTRYEK